MGVMILYIYFFKIGYLGWNLEFNLDDLIFVVIFVYE